MSEYTQKERRLMMNLAVGSLILMGLLLMVTGVLSKLLGVGLLAPYVKSCMAIFVGANSCFLLALIIEKFEK